MAGAGGQTPPATMPAPTDMTPVMTPPAPPPNTTPQLLFDITGIIGTGQSLSVGAMSPNPTNVARQAHFNNVRPLAWDTQLTPPNQGTEWEPGKGFELRQGNTKIAFVYFEPIPKHQQELLTLNVGVVNAGSDAVVGKAEIPFHQR